MQAYASKYAKTGSIAIRINNKCLCHLGNRVTYWSFASKKITVITAKALNWPRHAALVMSNLSDKDAQQRSVVRNKVL